MAVLAQTAMAGCGLIFLTAGFQKVRHRHVLPGVIANYRILPESLVGPAAIALPAVESLLGALLLMGLTPLPVIVGAALLSLFAMAMAFNLLRGRREISCGCGRPDLIQRLRWSSVIRNLLLAAALLTPLGFAAQLDPMARASGLFGGLALWLGYQLFEAIHAAQAAAAPAPHRRH
nr:MauE/DoxX family redox-associated membrane protein [Sphingobium sp. Sx8-8]